MRVDRKGGNSTQIKLVISLQSTCYVNGKTQITIIQITVNILLHTCTSISTTRISKFITSVQFISRKTRGKYVLVLDMNVSQYSFSRDIESEQNNGRNH